MRATEDEPLPSSLPPRREVLPPASEMMLRRWPDVMTIEVLREALAGPGLWPVMEMKHIRALVAWYDTQHPAGCPVMVQCPNGAWVPADDIGPVFVDMAGPEVSVTTPPDALPVQRFMLTVSRLEFDERSYYAALAEAEAAREAFWSRHRAAMAISKQRRD